MSRLSAIIEEFRPNLIEFEKTYKDIHQNPELGLLEFRTASIAAESLKGLGFKVHEGIGGYGVAGVLSNGNSGPIVLLRADMDALPINEATVLLYKSNRRDVMHACGHDMHVACMLATATLLQAAKSKWSGTLVCLLQPNEEGGAGAQSMVDDGLYAKIPVPDIILGQHVNHKKTGTLAICPGVFMAAADSFEVTIYGRGGHGAYPQDCIDPVLITSYILVRLQSIVSRLIAPSDAVVLTCGSIHGGDTENVIPDEVKFKINIRTYNETVREKVLGSMRHIINSECEASQTPKPPSITTISQFPLTNNDNTTVNALRATFQEFFNDDLSEQEILPGSEDISNLARPNNTPYAYWFFGGTSAKQWNEAERENVTDLLPRNHTSKFAPAIEPTLETGTNALALAALTFLCT